jgi:hypothetical protein
VLFAMLCAAGADVRRRPKAVGVDMKPKMKFAGIAVAVTQVPLRRNAGLSVFVRSALLALAIVTGLVVPLPAPALSASEAARVVQLLETLQQEFGDFAYDDEVADDWFEQDADSQGLIKAAGFTRQSWKKALDETWRGFLATIPEAEIRKSLADARRRAQQARSLTPEQQQAVLQLADENEKEIFRLRAEGEAFAAAVRPLAQRLRALAGQFAGDQ